MTFRDYYLLEAKRKKKRKKTVRVLNNIEGYKYFRELNPHISQHAHLIPTSVLKRYFTTQHTQPLTMEGLQSLTPNDLGTLLKDRSQSNPPYTGPQMTLDQAKELTYRVGQQVIEHINKHPYKTFNDGNLALINWIMIPVIKNIVFDKQGNLLVNDPRFKYEEYFTHFVALDILNALCSRAFIRELKPKDIKQTFD